MKRFKFKDGLVITASTVEEAKQKHKVMATKLDDEKDKKASDLVRKLGLDKYRMIGGYNEDDEVFYMDYANDVFHSAELTYINSSFKEFEKNITKNKEKWIELSKLADKLEDLASKITNY